MPDNEQRLGTIGGGERINPEERDNDDWRTGGGPGNRTRSDAYQQREQDTWHMGQMQPGAGRWGGRDRQRMGAEGQVWQGIADQRWAMEADAAAGGNPAAQRGAAYAGGELAARGSLMAEQVRQAQALADQRTQLGMTGRRPGVELGHIGMDTSWDLGQASLESDRQKAAAQDEIDEMRRDAQNIGALTGAFSGAGSMVVGAMSDERQKTNKRKAGGSEQDQTIRGLSMSGAGITEIGGHSDLGNIGRQLKNSDDEVNRKLDSYAARDPDREAEELYRELMADNPRNERRMGLGSIGRDPRAIPPSIAPQSIPPSISPADRQAMGYGRDLRRAGDDTMRQLDASRYNYSPHAQGALGQPKGPQYGVMAQQLERTPLGRSMVYDTPHGKMVDTNRAAMGSLGMIGRLGERVDELEGRRR